MKVKCMNKEDCQYKKEGYCDKPEFKVAKPPDYCLWYRLAQK